MFSIALALPIPLALLCAAVPWAASRLSSWLLALGLVVGILLSIVGVVLALALYPWTDGLVLLVALTGGLLLGRGIPPRFRPLLVLLVILSGLDVAQIVLTAGAPPPGPRAAAGPTSSPYPVSLLYGNFVLATPWGKLNIGLFDLLLVAAQAEHWRRRGGSYLIALVPVLVGSMLVAGYILLTGKGDLPLVPFLTAGWIGSEVLHRAIHRADAAKPAP